MYLLCERLSISSVGISKYFAQEIGCHWEITVDSTQLKIHKCRHKNVDAGLFDEKDIIKNDSRYKNTGSQFAWYNSREQSITSINTEINIIIKIETIGLFLPDIAFSLC